MKEKNSDNIQELSSWMKALKRKLDWSELQSMLWNSGNGEEIRQNIESIVSTEWEFEPNLIWPKECISVIKYKVMWENQ